MLNHNVKFTIILINVKDYYTILHNIHYELAKYAE